MQTRKDLRFEKKIFVNLTQEEINSLGITGNISKHGFFISSTHDFNKEAPVKLLLAIGNSLIEIEGKIVWKKEIKSSDSDKLIGMGINVVNNSKEYENYISDLEFLYMLKESRKTAPSNWILGLNKKSVCN